MTPDSLAVRSAFPERLTNDADVIIATLRSMKTGVSLETVGPIVVHDGRIRQAALQSIVRADQDWTAPFIIHLASQYVVEIRSRGQN